MKTILKIVLIITAITVLPSFTNVPAGDFSKTVLLIPYQPIMHLSDADADLAENSKITVRLARELMRNALTEKLALRLRENFYVRQLIQMGTADAKDDLNTFYNSENFYLSPRDTSKKSSPDVIADSEHPYFGIFKENSSLDYASSYMNISLNKPVLFMELSKEYEANYFVVLTQFEIKTHYNECVDIANRIFRREFLVHFSVFNAEGKQTGGTAVTYETGSDMNSISEITGTVFPVLVEKICAHVAAATP